MADETLSTELKWASTEQNVGDKPTAVATWDVPDGVTVDLRQGHPVILDVDANGGGNVERAAHLGLAYREPNDPLDAWSVISEFPIAPFNTLTLKDQQSGENAQRRRMQFDPTRVPNGQLTLEDTDEVALLMNSADLIEESSLYFDYPITVTQN